MYGVASGSACLMSLYGDRVVGIDYIVSCVSLSAGLMLGGCYV